MPEINLDNCGVPMERALDAKGCDIVREFLSALLTASDTPNFKGLGKFFKDYRECIHGYRHRRKEFSRTWTPDKVNEAIELHKTMQWADVADKIGCSRNAVKNAVCVNKPGGVRYR